MERGAIATVEAPSAERGRCELQYAAGRVEACAGPICPFWEEGGAVVEPGCALARLGIDIEGNPKLVAWLVRLRTMLAKGGGRAGGEEALHLFHRLVPPELRD